MNQSVQFEKPQDEISDGDEVPDFQEVIDHNFKYDLT